MANFFELDVIEIRNPNIFHPLKVRWFTTVKNIKEELHHKTHYPVNLIQLFHPSHTGPLRNDYSVRDLGFGLDLTKRPTLMMLLQFNTTQHILQPLTRMLLDKSCKDMIREVRGGLDNGIEPSKTDFLDCTGGVYFLRDNSGSIAAVFKPRDEEQGMPNNSKGYAGDGKNGLRDHFKPGKGFVREMAAYLMDVDHFCGVPPTTIVHCEHSAFHYPDAHNRAGHGRIYPKLGSLQKYVHASDIFEDISPSLISVFELQKIALLDMRILNCDRNSANILARRKSAQVLQNKPRSRANSMISLNDEEYEDMGQFLLKEPLMQSTSNDVYTLIPIDHGYCLPTKLQIEEFDWAWFMCKQVAQPVHPAIREYLMSIDIEHVLNDMKSQLNLPEESLFLIRVVHYLIVGGIESGLTLYDIACLIARKTIGVPSPLELALVASEENAFRTIEARNGFHEVATSLAMSVHRPRIRADGVDNCCKTGSTSESFDAHRWDNPIRSINSMGYHSLVEIDCVPTISPFEIAIDIAQSDCGDGDLTASEASSVEPISSPSMQSLSARRFSPQLSNPNDDLALETTTSEPVKLDNVELHHRDRALSCYTSEEDTDSQRDSMASSPSDCYMLDSLNLPFQGMPLIGMPRVASFGAFESPTMYDLDDRTDRHVQKLKKDKRRRLSKTPNFLNLKTQFVEEAIDSLLLRRFSQQKTIF